MVESVFVRYITLWNNYHATNRKDFAEVLKKFGSARLFPPSSLLGNPIGAQRTSRAWAWLTAAAEAIERAIQTRAYFMGYKSDPPVRGPY